MPELPILGKSYSLVDSGEGLKLERFGEISLIRPSSLCIWSKRRPKEWANADAEFIPKQGWNFRGKSFEEWRISFSNISLILRPQTNGQVGFFPEHAQLLPDVGTAIEAAKTARQKSPRVLNLFAFTGMASIWCAASGCEVTHVDMAKSALSWAEQNFKANSIAAERTRLIPDDALKFVERELKRGSVYDIIIADPPGFSRISKNSSWNIEEIITEFVGNCCKLLAPDNSTFVLSSHSSGLTTEVLGNLILDVFSDKVLIKLVPLMLQEQSSARLLPGGQAVVATK